MAFSDESGNSMVMPVSPLYGNGGNGYGSFGNDGFWIILLFILLGNNGWGGGFGGYGGGNSYRRGRAANGRFVSRDGSEMARKLREMMADAPDDSSRQEIQRLAERMEQM